MVNPSNKRHPLDSSEDSMWPLDLMLAGLAGLVLILILTNLSIYDKRLLHNATTYAISVPIIAFGLAFILRTLASKYVQKSIQIGFLFSVSLHLLMLMLATGVMVFRSYYPSTVMGVKPERSPVSRTVPEHLFKTTEKRDSQPDWSKPTDTETASRLIPREERKIPPVEHSAAQLEMPQPKQPIRKADRQHLLPREQPAESLPQPSNSPAKLARQRVVNPSTINPRVDRPKAPTAPMIAEVNLEMPQPDSQRMSHSKATTKTELQRSSSSQATSLAQPSPHPLAALEGQRQRQPSQPRIGNQGLERRSRQHKQAGKMRPAGAAPAPSAIAIARVEDAAHRMLARIESLQRPNSSARGAQMMIGNEPSIESQNSATKDASQSANTIDRLSASAGMPDINPGNASRPVGRSRRPRGGMGSEIAGSLIVGSNVADAANPSGADAELADDSSVDRLDGMGEIPTRQTRSALANGTPQETLAGSSGMLAQVMAEEGPIGIGNQIRRVAGIVPSKEAPKIASLDLNTGTRKRKEVGGPVTPFGTKVAAVESFSRRVMRTEGGRAPTPAGMVGPATEEAIERGLAYLKTIQNKDGSWSLQGHGTKVALRSDSAATGLCLLAFQGAGYTHKQHQYASTISRGLDFLIRNQKTSGDLYRSENSISDRNVAFYSHGIAALALCEAFGMTQDDQLKEPAQMSLHFISNTQNRMRGGWRYASQVSADTSVSGWMMMALKSGQLSGLKVPQQTYDGIDRWLDFAQVGSQQRDRYRYNPFAPNTPSQQHGRLPTPTMTAVGMLMRMYSGWQRDNSHMKSAADYLLEHPPRMGTPKSPQRDGYYWYYATQVMFHMGGEHWEKWNNYLSPVLLESQLEDGSYAGSWDPVLPIRDRWSVHAGRLYVTTMNLLNLEVYYRHLPIYEDTAYQHTADQNTTE